MRFGIYGGTFDPVHLGHLLLAEQCREQCSLDEVWFVPAGAPPHKTDWQITPAQQRLEMLEFAIAGHDKFRMERLELDRAGPSFTVETLQLLHDARPGNELFLLLGADSVHDFPTWREPQRILQLATIVAVNRGDHPPCDFSKLVQLFGKSTSEKFVSVQMPGLDISSRDIRQRVREGHSIRYLVPRAVEAYIAQHQLYQGDSTNGCQSS